MYFYKKIDGSDRCVAVNVCERCGREFLTLFFADTMFCDECASQNRRQTERRCRSDLEAEHGDRVLESAVINTGAIPSV